MFYFHSEILLAFFFNCLAHALFGNGKLISLLGVL